MGIIQCIYPTIFEAYPDLRQGVRSSSRAYVSSYVDMKIPSLTQL